MSSLQMPAALTGMMGGGAGQPLPAGLTPPEQGEPADKEDPLDVLQECIQALPKVIAALPDPQDTQDAIAALQILAKIQTRLMKGQQSAPPQGQ